MLQRWSRSLMITVTDNCVNTAHIHSHDTTREDCAVKLNVMPLYIQKLYVSFKSKLNNVIEGFLYSHLGNEVDIKKTTESSTRMCYWNLVEF